MDEVRERVEVAASRMERNEARCRRERRTWRIAILLSVILSQCVSLLWPGLPGPSDAVLTVLVSLGYALLAFLVAVTPMGIALAIIGLGLRSGREESDAVLRDVIEHGRRIEREAALRN